MKTERELTENEALNKAEVSSSGNFYCTLHSGSMESIEEWNEVQKSLELTNLTEKEKQNILFPPVCKKQCFDCIAEVGKTRLKTQNLIKAQSS